MGLLKRWWTRFWRWAGYGSTVFFLWQAGGVVLGLLGGGAYLATNVQVLVLVGIFLFIMGAVIFIGASAFRLWARPKSTQAPEPAGAASSRAGEPTAARFDRHVADQLRGLSGRAQDLLGRHSGLNMGDSAKQWVAEAIEWVDDAERFVAANLPLDETYMFETISPKPRQPDMPLGEIHASLRDRHHKLRLITSRYLKGGASGGSSGQ